MEHLRTTASGFFHSFRCFLSPSKLIKTSFFYFFEHVLSRVSNVRNEYYKFKRHSCGCMETHIYRRHHMEFSGVLLTNQCL